RKSASNGAPSRVAVPRTLMRSGARACPVSRSSPPQAAAMPPTTKTRNRIGRGCAGGRTVRRDAFMPSVHRSARLGSTEASMLPGAVRYRWARRDAFGLRGAHSEAVSCHSLRGIAARHDWPHDSGMTDTATLIQQFNEAFLLRAPERLVDIIADNCVMEGVGPA